MALRLPRFLRSVPLVEQNGTPSLSFHQWWDTTLKEIEKAVGDIQIALLAAGIALDGGGALPPLGVRTITVSDSVSSSDNLIVADATAGDITVTLPPAASAKGKEVIVKKISDPPRTVTIEAHDSEEIDGAINVVLDVKNEATHLVSDGVEWWTI